jgi:TonB-linked SusC/RagA family outer membrane protein
MSGKATLVITAVGYENLEEPIKGRSTLTLQLNTDTHALSDVVVTGVGVATSRKKVAIDVASVSAQDFAKSATSDVGSALIGQVAGAQIQQTTGSPNSSVNIILRGINTISNGTGPIFLLDGIKIDDINGIDPAIVDHIEVVKGPAAGMLYGSEGANGAIQIFTKRGSRNGHMSVTVSSKLSLDNVLTGKRPLNAGFHHYVTDASGNILDATGNKLTHDAVGYWPDPVEEDYNADPTVTNSKPFVGLPLYNHIKQAYQQASTYTNAVNIMGGGEKTDYSFTASRLDQQSIFGNKYNRTNMTLNLGLQLAKGFTFRTNTQGIYGYDDLLGGNRFGLINTYPWINFDFRDSIGNLVLKPKNENQLNSLSERQWHQHFNKTYRVVENIDLNYKFWRFLELDYKIGVDFNIADAYDYYLNQDNTLQSDLFWGPSREGSVTDQYTLYTKVNSLATAYLRLDFAKDLHIHIPLKSTTQFSYDYWANNERYYYGEGTSLPPFQPANINLATNKTSGDYASATTSYGLLLNETLDYGNLFGVSAGFRSDYSSQFGDASKPFTFPRGTAYFRPSELMGSRVIPDWKLRAAYGAAGSPPPGAYDRQVTLTTATLGGGVSLSLPGNAANPNLRVQKTYELEIGTDVTVAPSTGAWLSSITLSGSYWHHKSQDVIQTAQVAPSSGYGGTEDNLVDLSSKGVDLSLDAMVANMRNFVWTMGIRFGKATTTLDKVSNGKDVITGEFISRQGQQLGTFYGQEPVHSIGQLQADGKTPYIDPSTASQYALVNGNVVNTTTYQGVVTNAADLKIMGHALPKYTASLINRFTVLKNFSLSVQFDMVHGNSIYNITRQWLYRDRLSKDFDGPVTIAGKTGAFVAYYNSYYNSTSPISWFIEDGSFIRLRDLSLTYNLDARMLAHSHFIRTLALTVGGRNLLTFTKYHGLDPENTGSDGNNNFSLGVDDFGIPNMKSYQFGLTAGF